MREAEEKDIEKCCELYKSQYSETIQKEYKSIKKYLNKALKKDLKYLNDYYLNINNHNFWVAIIVNDSDNNNENNNNDNEIVGMIGIRENKPWNENNKNNKNNENNVKKTAEIVRFGVSLKYRKKGIGKSLIDHAIKFCVKMGYNCIVASTMNVLNDAILFYTNYGFQLQLQEKCGNDNNQNNNEQNNNQNNKINHQTNNQQKPLEFYRFSMDIP